MSKISRLCEELGLTWYPHIKEISGRIDSDYLPQDLLYRDDIEFWRTELKRLRTEQKVLMNYLGLHFEDGKRVVKNSKTKEHSPFTMVGTFPPKRISRHKST